MKKEMLQWHVKSPVEPGYHDVILPGRDAMEILAMHRLNLEPGMDFNLHSAEREMHILLVQGEAEITGAVQGRLNKLDSFYIPGEKNVKIQAVTRCIFYIADAPCEGKGQVRMRHFDSSLPIGDIHQIHGQGSGAREVMFTLAPQDEASRLICGVTRSGDGTWTSWPPHQHEADLEEIYCYFDMEKCGLHFSYLTKEKFSDAICHTVETGSMVQIPAGYHPTAALPGGRNIYFWAMGAKSHDARRYDLAKPDPEFI